MRSFDANPLAALDCVSDWILLVHEDGTVEAANQPARAVVGAGRLSPAALTRLAVPEHRERLERFLKNRAEYPERVAFRTKGGGRRELEFRFHPPRPDSGTILTGRDITLQKKLEEQLQMTQKREALGILAGGIAHDFNNLLTGILGYSELLRMECEPGERFHDALTVIHQAAGQAAQLTSQILSYARQDQQKYSLVSIHPVVQEVVALLGRTLDKRIQIEMDLQAGAPAIMGDGGQIHQVLLNLALNARDAMPEGGRLLIRTCIAEPSPDLPLRSLPHLEIAVSDTGVGIPPELRERIFDPFFTTKAEGKGNGIGLTVVNGIVKSHGGLVRLSSATAEGSTFRIYLPLAQEGSIAGSCDSGRKPEPGRGTILLIDDEDIVRQVCARMLEGLGYRVVPFHDCGIALSYYAEHLREIDLVILDRVMPTLGGKECYLAMRDLNPEVRAILASGYDRDENVRDMLALGVTGFIQKPYQLAQLAATVADALSAARAIVSSRD